MAKAALQRKDTECPGCQIERARARSLDIGGAQSQRTYLLVSGESTRQAQRAL